MASKTKLPAGFLWLPAALSSLFFVAANSRMFCRLFNHPTSFVDILRNVIASVLAAVFVPCPSSFDFTRDFYKIWLTTIQRVSTTEVSCMFIQSALQLNQFKYENENEYFCETQQLSQKISSEYISQLFSCLLSR